MEFRRQGVYKGYINLDLMNKTLALLDILYDLLRTI